MDIAVFNWKDWAHPAAGGAEEFTHQVLIHWAQTGNRVRLYTSRGPGQGSHDYLEGVAVTRAGSIRTVFRKAREAYVRDQRPDVILDEINTRPFQVPRFGGRPTVALIHQLAREYWFLELPYPVAWFGYHFLEPHWLKPYRDVPTVTVSPSTAQDLRSLGFRRVAVVPEGCSVAPRADVPPKESRPTLVFLGRLTRAKRPDHALEAFRILRHHLPETRLLVVGDGYMRGALERRAPPGTTFVGRVGGRERERLLAGAHLLLVPGVREGWGLVVTEAAAVGTPAVAYRVPGLRDSVEDGVTGLLTDPEPRALAAAAVALLTDGHRLRSMAEAALESARQYSWARTAVMLLDLLRRAAEGRSQEGPGPDAPDV